MAPEQSTQRRWRRRIKKTTASTVGLLTLFSVALVAQPATATSRLAHLRLPPPPNTVHHKRIIGNIFRPKIAHRPYICSPGPAPIPAPSTDTLAYLAEPSNNEVQIVDEDTGALVGSPITVGTSPKGIAYWEPPAGSGQDPLVVASNSGSHSVTIIDALTQSVVSTVSLPSGSTATGVAASTTEPYALVIDSYTGKVSVIDLLHHTDAGEISLTSTAYALSSIAFSANGSYAYVTDPTEHKIFVLEYTGGSAPYFTQQTTYTNSTYDFAGIATDQTTSSSSTLMVTDQQSSSSGRILVFNDSSGTLSAPTVLRTLASYEPGPVEVSPGGTYVYVAMVGSREWIQEQITYPYTTNWYTAPSSFTSTQSTGLSADGSTLLLADSASGAVQEVSTSSGANTSSTSADSSVYAIAPAFAAVGSWNAFVPIQASNVVDVVNVATQSVTETITDSNGPRQVVASPDGQYVYVANTSTVSVIQTSLIGTTSNPLITTITGIQGSQPNTPDLNGGIAISPSGDSLLVGDTANGAIDVIDLNAADSSSYYRHVVNRIGVLGSGIYSTLANPASIAVGPDGLYAYATIDGISSTSYDGVTELSLASATTTGYSFDANQAGLTQDGQTLEGPNGIAIQPNDETVYVEGTSTVDTPSWALWAFPIGTNGQLSNGSSTVAPVNTGLQGAGVTYSPEDDSAFVTDTASFSMDSVSQLSDSVTYTTGTGGWPGPVAVSPDGIDVAVATLRFCNEGSNALDLFDAGSGTNLGNVALPGIPVGVAIAPQSSPRTVPTTELAGGTSNPAEAAVSGMNDVVSSGTPSDAPGAAGGVDTATGAYSLSIDSMTIPDIGPPLDMTASYDSSRASTNSLLGYGWDYSYGTTASQNTTTCVVTVTFADGATTTFNPSTSSGACSSRTYQPESWAQDALTFSSNCNGTDSCFVVKLDGMTKYFIDETTGQLVEIEDLNNNAVTISWGSHSACSGATSTEPCQVTAADGIRTLTFSYPSAGSGTCPSGSYTCVVVTDPLGRTLTYVENSSSQLVQIALANTSETATYALSYGSGNLLASWWDPQNNASHAANTSYATDVTYTSGAVTQVTGPEIYSAAPLSTTAITPTTTFTYENVDTSTGNGAVLVKSPDFNQSNYEPGASETLDTYADFQLVSSITGYGPLKTYYNGSSAPVVATNPSESAYPMRDPFNLMASESMNALAGTTEPAVGTQNAQYDNGVVLTTYDAHGNALSTTDEQGNTSTNTYNGLNEVVTSTDALGNQTVNTYNSTGQLLTTTSPPTNSGGSSPKTSSYYNSNGTMCASRDADQVSAYGVLTSCVSAGSNAMTITYDSSGDQSLSTVTDSSTQTSTTQSEYDADGNVCATLSPDGYAITGDRLSSCPSSGAPYASVTLNRDVYGNALEQVSSQSVAPSNAYATTYACTNVNGDTTASVGPLGSTPTCPDTSYTSSVDTTFTTYDPMGDTIQTISPFAATGTQGPTNTSQFDADASAVLGLSADGYVVWENNNSADLTPYETGTLMDDQGNSVASAPQTDLTSTCESDIRATAAGQEPSSLCPDTSYTAYDNQGQQLQQTSSSNGQTSGLSNSASTNNPNGAVGGTQTGVGGGTGVSETSQRVYDANGNTLKNLNEHWNGSAWVTDSSSSTAYAPDGSQCWSSPTTVSSPTCSSPPTGTGTADYYDLNGNVIAQVGPGGSGVIGTSGHCNPLAALATEYTINTSDLCAFTTYNVYNEANQLIETIEPSPSNSTTSYVTAGITMTWTYDPSGNKATEVNPAGNTVTDTYDGANRLVGITYSDVGTTNCSAGGSTQDTCYSYNADGTRSEMVDSTGTTTYSYDDAGKLSSVTDSNSNTVTYGYNAFGAEDCISYPGFSTSYSCLASGNPNNGTNTIDAGEVWYSYDQQGRSQTIQDWNGDAFTHGYDCTGDVAWLAETPSSQVPAVSPCQGSSGSVPTAPSPASTGTTFIDTSYSYGSGSSGNLLNSQSTDAVTHSGSTSLLEFNSLSYDNTNNLTSSTPKVSGTTETADGYTYDSQERVKSGPETSGSKTGYSYVNSSGTQPFYSTDTVDEMGIDAMPYPGSTAQLGSEYTGNGELCWVAEVTSTTGTCSNPSGSATNYETVNFNSSGDMTGTSASGYGFNTSESWNVDMSEPTCINPGGTSCTGPSSSQPGAESYAYNADGIRVKTQSWDASTSSVVTTDSTWSGSELLSQGSFDYVYGLEANAPIAQIDTGDGVTGELLSGLPLSVKGIVEVSTSAGHPFQLANYTDYDSYGNPMTASSGATNAGGLTNEGESGDIDSQTRFGFAGGFADSSGLDYLIHRYYSPALGQFISVDPALGTTQTPFSYASDNPVSRTDPSGQVTVGPFTAGPNCYRGPGLRLMSILNEGIYCLAPRKGENAGFTVTSDWQDITSEGQVTATTLPYLRISVSYTVQIEQVAGASDNAKAFILARSIYQDGSGTLSVGAHEFGPYSSDGQVQNQINAGVGIMSNFNGAHPSADVQCPNGKTIMKGTGYYCFAGPDANVLQQGWFGAAWRFGNYVVRVFPVLHESSTVSESASNYAIAVAEKASHLIGCGELEFLAPVTACLAGVALSQVL